MRPAPTRMIERYLCDTAVAAALWASVDLDEVLQRTASGDGVRLLGIQLRSRKPRPRSLKTHRRNSISADNLDLSRVQRPVWDTERRYGETHNPDSPRFSLLIDRTVFTPRKDPLRLHPVLAADCSQECQCASGWGGSCARDLWSLLYSRRESW